MHVYFALYVACLSRCGLQAGWVSFSSRGRPKTDLQIAIFVGLVWSPVSQSAFTGEYSCFVSTNYCSLSPLMTTSQVG